MNTIKQSHFKGALLLIELKNKFSTQCSVQLLSVLLFAISPFFAKGQEEQRKIHPQNLELSQTFKTKSGQNRLAEFNLMEGSLMASISTDLKPNYDYFIGDFQITSTELITLLGEPDTKVSNGIWIYVLDPVSGCKAVIGIEPTGYLSYVIKKECN